MGKRSSFPRLDRDNYPTPYKATTPLLECLKPRTKFIDPCCGAGFLVAHFESAGHVCVGRYDLPDRDVVSARYDDVEPDAIFVTNLPWRRDVLHPAIINLSNQRPLWTLLDAGWLFTMQAAPFMARLRGIVAVGRLKWIPDSKHTAKDDAAWMLFDRPRPNETTVIHFVGRSASTRRAA